MRKNAVQNESVIILTIAQAFYIGSLEPVTRWEKEGCWCKFSRRMRMRMECYVKVW